MSILDGGLDAVAEVVRRQDVVVDEDAKVAAAERGAGISPVACTTFRVQPEPFWSQAPLPRGMGGAHKEAQRRAREQMVRPLDEGPHSSLHRPPEGDSMRRQAMTILLGLILTIGLAGTTEGGAIQNESADKTTSLHASQWQLAQELHENLNDSRVTGVSEPIDTARTALDHRQTMVDDSHVNGPLDRQASNLELAGTLVEQEPGLTGTSLAEAVDRAKIASQAQAASLGLPYDEQARLPTHEEPSEAVLALLDLHDVQPSVRTLASIAALNDVPRPVAQALTEVIDAHYGLDVATTQAYEDISDDELPQLGSQASYEAIQKGRDAPSMETEDRVVEGNVVTESGLDLAPVFPARDNLLESILSLDAALRENPLASSNVCQVIRAPPAFSIDLAGCDTTYTEDYALLIDVGGNNTYYNNAGGSGIDTLGFPCRTESAGSAALIDLGRGDNTFGHPDLPRSCGANGGGNGGVGFLLDAGGDDEYIASSRGTNGGGVLGLGFLLDVGGKDSYEASSFGTNGGGNLGAGFLLDARGADDYIAGYLGANGGGFEGGTGFLFDGEGDDGYIAGGGGANGGGSQQAHGFLVDADGNNTYKAGSSGVNGGGARSATGFLFDAGGNTTYVAGDRGANGGAWSNRGVGFLYDAGGDDDYDAGSRGTNGGGNDEGIGFLVDGGGNDTYSAGFSGFHSRGVNGGGATNLGVGFLFDASGDDKYTGHKGGANGGKWQTGAGFLLDAQGNDSYVAECCGANGGASDEDTVSRDGSAVLFDVDGADYYEDDRVPGGACWDCSVLPKGTVDPFNAIEVGAQVDSDDPSIAGTDANAANGDRSPADPFQITTTRELAETESQDGQESYRQNPSANGVLDERCGEHEIRGPIRITEDHGPHGFTWTEPTTGERTLRPASGVVAGSGTADDPYVIEGWCISTPPSNPTGAEQMGIRHSEVELTTGGDDPLPAIHLDGTDSHVILRDNAVVGESGELATKETGWGAVLQAEPSVGEQGIRVEGAANVGITSNRVTGAHTGIFVNGSENMRVENNTVAHNGNSLKTEIFQTAEHWSPGTGSGVIISNSPGTVVQENTVRDNGLFGIYSEDSPGVRVEDNKISHNGYHGVGIADSDRALIQNNLATDHRMAGFDIAGIHLMDSDEVTVIDNRASANGVGLGVAGSDDVVVRRNVAVDNSRSGIQLLSSDEAIVRENTASENGGGSGTHPAGIKLRGSQVASVHTNTIKDNEGTGLLLQGAHGAVLQENELDHNVRDGVLLDRTNALLEENVLTGNLQNGVRAWEAGEVVLEANEFIDNGEHGLYIAHGRSAHVTVQNNTVNDSGEHGIHLELVDGVEVTGNLISGNGLDGLNLLSTEGTIARGNTLTGNNEHGIRLYEGWTGSPEDNQIEANEIAWNWWGIHVSKGSGTVVHANNVHGNFVGTGLNATAMDDTVDARDNWWGCEDGPDHEACEDVRGDATYDPWLTAPNPDAGT